MGDSTVILHDTADKRDLRPTSIRIDENARKMLSELTEKMGAKNQNETLHALISTWEMNEAKLVVPQKEDEIQTFHECTQRLLQLYLGSLDDTMHMRDVVRSEYENNIRSKDAVIRDLQRQLEESKVKFTEAMDLLSRRDKEKTEHENSLRTLEGENRRLQMELTQAQSENDSMKQTIAINEKFAREHSQVVAERDILLQEKKSSDFIHRQELAELELRYKKELLDEKERMHKEYLELVSKVVSGNQTNERDVM